MKSDIYKFMQEQSIDALWITGSAQHNPAMFYFTGNYHITQADLLIRCDSQAILFHGPMERDEAAKTGFYTRSYSDYPLQYFQKISGGDFVRARALRYQKILQDCGIFGGKVALYGMIELSSHHNILCALQELMPGVTFTGETDDGLLSASMVTKDDQEIDRIRKMGKITTTIVSKVQEFLADLGAKDGIVVDSDDEPVTIGKVKAAINQWVAEMGVENPEGTIFSQGRDAGVPHSTGNDEEKLRTGQTIVFDFFPCETGGGYFYDFTRTWSLGYATDEAYQLFEDVKQVYQTLIQEYQVNQPCQYYQERTCQLFEDMGHVTVLSNPKTEKGYVHSIGHGLGLRVHEAPWFGMTTANKDIIRPGNVFSVEPGLYYPDKDMGVRLEDTVAILPDGRLEVLAPYPMELVIPLRDNR